MIQCAREIPRDVRFHDVATAATLKRGVDHLVRGVHAQKDRWRSQSSLPQRVKGLKPVEPGHIDIQDDDVRVNPGRRLDRLPAIECDTHHIKVVGQHRGDGVEDLPVVIHEKDSRPRSSAGPPATRE